MRKLTAAAKAAGLGLAACISFTSTAPAIAQDAVVTQETLLDRIQIEDFLTAYYYNFSGAVGHDFAKYYTEDAIFDVNGKIYVGRDAIAATYGGSEDNGGSTRGTFHMLMNNLLIQVHGDTATARTIWTGVMSDRVKAPPRLAEQGREYTVLVKEDGNWRIKKRVIISDAALGDQFDGIYEPRRNYDPLKDEPLTGK